MEPPATKKKRPQLPKTIDAWVKGDSSRPRLSGVRAPWIPRVHWLREEEPELARRRPRKHHGRYRQPPYGGAPQLRLLRRPAVRTLLSSRAWPPATSPRARGRASARTNAPTRMGTSASPARRRATTSSWPGTTTSTSSSRCTTSRSPLPPPPSPSERCRSSAGSALAQRDLRRRQRQRLPRPWRDSKASLTWRSTRATATGRSTNRSPPTPRASPTSTRCSPSFNWLGGRGGLRTAQGHRGDRGWWTLAGRSIRPTHGRSAAASIRKLQVKNNGGLPYRTQTDPDHPGFRTAPGLPGVPGTDRT